MPRKKACSIGSVVFAAAIRIAATAAAPPPSQGRPAKTTTRFGPALEPRRKFVRFHRMRYFQAAIQCYLPAPKAGALTANTNFIGGLGAIPSLLPGMRRGWQGLIVVEENTLS